MKTAIYGGTFDPIHIGHLFLASQLAADYGYLKVIFVPANIHSLKASSTLASDRLAMARLALDGIGYAVVDSCDIDRGGKTYSIDTVDDVTGRYDIDGKPGFVLGDDLVGGFESWKEPERLASICDLIVARRRWRRPRPFRNPHVSMDNPILSISSSEFRERIRRGLTVENLVPGDVIRYIESRGIYRT